MPRKRRIVLVGYPHHIVQRGHDRNAVFADDEDYQYYLENIAECKQTYAIKLYAYCLMTNHVHLLLQPDKDEDSISQFMKVLAALQRRKINLTPFNLPFAALALTGSTRPGHGLWLSVRGLSDNRRLPGSACLSRAGV